MKHSRSGTTCTGHHFARTPVLLISQAQNYITILHHYSFRKHDLDCKNPVLAGFQQQQSLTLEILMILICRIYIIHVQSIHSIRKAATERMICVKYLFSLVTSALIASGLLSSLPRYFLVPVHSITSSIRYLINRIVGWLIR